MQCFEMISNYNNFSFCSENEITITLSRYKELLRDSENLKKLIEKNDKLKNDLIKKGAEIKKLRKLKNRQTPKVRMCNFDFSFSISNFFELYTAL